MLKLNLTKSIFLVLSFLLTLCISAQPITLSDNFEESQINSFWSLYEQNGVVELTTEESFSGTQSVKLSSTSNEGTRNVALQHFFPEQMKGEISVKFFDTSPGLESLYSGLYLFNHFNDPTEHFFALTYDWDGEKYWVNSGNGAVQTTVDRTAGWHEFKIIFSQSQIEFFIDGNSVLVTAGDYSFDQVNLRLYGPDFRPDAHFYFDDFYINAYPAASEGGINQYVALAEKNLVIMNKAKITSGSIGVNNPNDGPFGCLYELTIGKNVTLPEGYEAIANKVYVAKKADVKSDVAYNVLENEGVISGALINPIELPLVENMPEFVEASVGSENIRLRNNKTITIPPGNYGKIKTGNKCKIIFEGGVYNIRSINTGNKCELLFNGSSEIRIYESLDTDLNCYIGPNATNITAKDIKFYIEGKKWYTLIDCSIGINNNVKANFYAPNGTIWVKKKTSFEGSLVGKNIVVGFKVNLVLNSGWSFSTSALKGSPGSHISSAEGSEIIKNDFVLEQNYPNPFNPSTTISYNLPENTSTKLTVFNSIGETVALLVDEFQSAGFHKATFDASKLCSGIYFYRLETDRFSEIKKMILVK